MWFPIHEVNELYGVLRSLNCDKFVFRIWGHLYTSNRATVRGFHDEVNGVLWV